MMITDNLAFLSTEPRLGKSRNLSWTAVGKMFETMRITSSAIDRCETMLSNLSLTFYTRVERGY